MVYDFENLYFATKKNLAKGEMSMDYADKLNKLLLNYENQEELANKLNVPANSLSRWLNHGNNPTRKNCLIIDNLYIREINPLNQINLFDNAKFGLK